MLKRRLALLVDQKRLVAEGRGKGRRHRSPPISGDALLISSGAKPEGRVEIYVQVSPEGEAIKQVVREPIQNRSPVGYNRAFLEDYRPNETFYLPCETRQRLLGMGRSPDGRLPAGTYARKIYSRLLIDLSWNSSRLDRLFSPWCSSRICRLLRM